MDLWKRTAEAANIISAVAAIYVLFKPPATPASGAVMNPTISPVSPSLVVLCVSVLTAGVLNFIALQRVSRVVTTETPSDIPPPAQEPEPTSEDEATVEYLVGLFKLHTSIQAQRHYEQT